MLNRNLLSCALAALLAVPLALSGCGGVTEDPGSGPKSCSEDTDCDTTELCHPVGQVCVKTCTEASECGGGACEAVNATETRTICKCTAGSCGTVTVDGGDNLQVCSAGIDDLCENRCAQDSDCGEFFPSRTCDVASGLCKPETGGCTANAQCTTAAASKCDTTSKACVACTVDAECGHISGLTKCNAGTCVSPGTSCSEVNKQPNTTTKGPDTCSYGELCSASVCSATALPDMTCNSAKSTGAPTWDKAAFGPVIYNVRSTQEVRPKSANGTDLCANGGGGFIVEFDFYAPNGVKGGTWSERAAQVKFIEIKVPESAGIIDIFPSAGATFGHIRAGGCGKTGGNSIDPSGYSVYMIDAQGKSGNLACLTKDN